MNSGSKFRPGVYQHYKGGLYLGLLKAQSSEQRKVSFIVYFSLRKLTFWVRPFDIPLLEGDDCWDDLIVWPDGVTRPRFVRKF